MALTSAERTKRYRDKLKSLNPKKFEEFKKKNAERMKAHKRRIADMSEREKEVMRKRWRNAKRRQLLPRKEVVEDYETEHSRSNSHEVRQENQKLKKKINNMALTAAQRARRYREKLKATNPEKYEEMKKRNSERTKVKKRRIADMTEGEKEAERMRWRNAKRRQKLQRKQVEVIGEKLRRYNSDVRQENQALKKEVKDLFLKNVDLTKTLAQCREEIRILTEKLNHLSSERDIKISVTSLEKYEDFRESDGFSSLSGLPTISVKEELEISEECFT